MMMMREELLGKIIIMSLYQHYLSNTCLAKNLNKKAEKKLQITLLKSRK
jgi:hypothetical protein